MKKIKVIDLIISGEMSEELFDYLWGYKDGILRLFSVSGTKSNHYIKIYFYKNTLKRYAIIRPAFTGYYINSPYGWERLIKKLLDSYVTYEKGKPLQQVEQ
jgi:hypothetical protein